MVKYLLNSNDRWVSDFFTSLNKTVLIDAINTENGKLSFSILDPSTYSGSWLQDNIQDLQGVTKLELIEEQINPILTDITAIKIEVDEINTSISNLNNNFNIIPENVIGFTVEDNGPSIIKLSWNTGNIEDSELIEIEWKKFESLSSTIVLDSGFITLPKINSSHNTQVYHFSTQSGEGYYAFRIRTRFAFRVSNWVVPSVSSRFNLSIPPVNSVTFVYANVPPRITIQWYDSSFSNNSVFGRSFTLEIQRKSAPDAAFSTVDTITVNPRTDSHVNSYIYYPRLQGIYRVLIRHNVYSYTSTSVTSGETTVTYTESAVPVYVFRRSDTTPTKPANGSGSIDSSYVINPPSGWSSTVPAGSSPLWSVFTYMTQGSSSHMWSDPISTQGGALVIQYGVLQEDGNITVANIDNPDISHMRTSLNGGESWSAWVRIRGQGDTGSGLVFNGSFSDTAIYVSNSDIKSIVRHNGSDWLAVNANLDSSPGDQWGEPDSNNTNWRFLGNQALKYVATDILLAEDAVVTKTLTIGESGGDKGNIQSSNFEEGYSGWRISHDGNAEFHSITSRTGDFTNLVINGNFGRLKSGWEWIEDNFEIVYPEDLPQSSNIGKKVHIKSSSNYPDSSTKEILYNNSYFELLPEEEFVVRVIYSTENNEPSDIGIKPGIETFAALYIKDGNGDWQFIDDRFRIGQNLFDTTISLEGEMSGGANIFINSTSFITVPKNPIKIDSAVLKNSNNFSALGWGRMVSIKGNNSSAWTFDPEELDIMPSLGRVICECGENIRIASVFSTRSFTNRNRTFSPVAFDKVNGFTYNVAEGGSLDLNILSTDNTTPILYQLNSTSVGGRNSTPYTSGTPITFNTSGTFTVSAAHVKNGIVGPISTITFTLIVNSIPPPEPVPAPLVHYISRSGNVNPKAKFSAIGISGSILQWQITDDRDAPTGTWSNASGDSNSAEIPVERNRTLWVRSKIVGPPERLSPVISRYVVNAVTIERNSGGGGIMDPTVPNYS